MARAALTDYAKGCGGSHHSVIFVLVKPFISGVMSCDDSNKIDGCGAVLVERTVRG